MTTPTWAYRTQRWLAKHTHRRLLPLRGDAGVVSFSFDDAPQSACQQGAAILERHGCQGTWYLAGKLTGQLDLGHQCHSAADIRRLLQDGHHVACHTWSHRNCAGLSAAELQDEFSRNDAFLAQCGLAERPLHFSFPLGAFDLRAKAMAGQQFASCRITGGGLQSGHADLNGLKSERLYAQEMQPDRLRSLVQETARQKGWLIFYTHDVVESPGPWGCTPALLELAVRSALDAGCRVMPVDQAIRYWQAP